jgi:hypothetical protein
VSVVYGAAHVLWIGSIVAAAIAAGWLILRVWRNYRIWPDQAFARRRRARLLFSVPSLVLVAAIVVGSAAWFIGLTRVTTTTVGSLLDQGRTSNQAGLRTEAEVYQTTVTTTVYYRLPGNSPVTDFVNQIGQYLLHQDQSVGVQVAEYGLVDFATARSATATVDAGRHTITVALPTPTAQTYIYSVGSVKFAEGPLNAIGTAVRATFAALLHEPLVSVNVSSELTAAQNAVAKAANPAEIYGCGKNEMEQQLAGIFGTVPQYRGWTVSVQFPGMRTVPESQCQALAARLVRSG